MSYLLASLLVVIRTQNSIEIWLTDDREARNLPFKIVYIDGSFLTIRVFKICIFILTYNSLLSSVS